MKLCVYGAGGVGGGLAVPLALSGVDVSLVARGAHGEAIARDGLSVVQGESRRTAKVRVSTDPAALGVQDVVVVTVKATDPAGLAASLPGLLGPDTAVVFAQILMLPTNKVSLFFIADLPAWLFGILYLAYTYALDKRGGDHVAHDAHFFGAIFGVLFTFVLRPALVFDFGVLERSLGM